ncbi:MAG: hypothetical protein P5694_23465 [Limnospira sp. PMC 1286.21]|uniref:Uncharacterized protein n=3 Tax=Limnospira TaxID=2596745 RepID=A0A9P1P0I7_9CYAN|nr:MULTISPECIES: hypothetical protein [unclassified Limnospira]EDZ94493.1 hypothetical protein AmaxDRAFT_2692 [Limnospira maxima CS-328]MDT9200976.1 hypothetical protein [Limnospira sp. PMC 1042.18]MDT9216379.1 hypothetical protein [Limnospira sp. PMC 1256.20]MDT9282882.1 hypothetical protein [Limnospira sp. PMC 1293.21]MDT9287746.1 hypothetical protein [Limnospira sp. PMC 1298.21]MDT9328650.1 hypothetical protein [Limnospira sp. PMC 1286.21]UWU47009.1 hypothetical protein APLC1_1748 [Arthro
MSEAPLTLPLLMDSQKPAQLQQHLDAIAAILYSEANPAITRLGL